MTDESDARVRPKYGYDDPKLSWKAKGLLRHLMANDEDRAVSDLLDHATDGQSSVLSGLQELAEAGYIEKGKERDEHGRFVGGILDVRLVPREEPAAE